MSDKIISTKNSYGEVINVKLVDGIVMVHHEDCNDDFITLNDLFLKAILNITEIVIILQSAKQLYLLQLETEIEK